MHRTDSFNTVILAGGGNRCWWQAGFMQRLIDLNSKLPRRLYGTSAGAAIAASCITSSPKLALEACIDLYSNNRSNFLKKRNRLQIPIFAHNVIYPSWVKSFVNKSNFNELIDSETHIYVSITRPSPVLGKHISLISGTVLYIIDKIFFNSLHPVLPGKIGLCQEFLPLSQAVSIEVGLDILLAAAAAPPMLPAKVINKTWAFDGGYYDSAPLPAQNRTERESTIVLLTRHYHGRKSVFTLDSRTYLQPSKKIPVSTWDCTFRTNVNDAFKLGYKDAESFLRS